MRLPPGDPSEVEQKKAEIIRALIQQQVLAQQAIQQKLDRTPDAVVLLDAARLEMLTQLYLADYASHLQRPQQTEVQKFYRDNPAMFGQRRSYLLLQLTLPKSAEKSTQVLTDGVAASHSLEDIAAGLRSAKVEHSLELLRKDSSDLDPDVAAKLGGQGIGGVASASVDGKTVAWEIKEMMDSPVDMVTAQPTITQLLVNKLTQAALPAQVDRLVQTTPVQYVGDFAKYEKLAPPAGTSSTNSAIEGGK